MTWRTKIAQVAGFPPLCLMEGFWIEGEVGDPIKYVPHEEMKKQINESLPIRWELFKPDPLIILLHHSDCEGEIGWRDCLQIARRLEQVLPLLPAEDNSGHIGDWRTKTQKFIHGLVLAYDEEENIVFS
ncbi:hypothetical protein [Nostoc sp. NMS7]|uniref:hypothetical protein n=1 Tax=Nostoc sp. NMS7 TaxID=2815391 RepID=UPI0025CD32BA|nr:hypothetical protein [Nostoc sp. NMS7]